jgi:hypothetical protein
MQRVRDIFHSLATPPTRARARTVSHTVLNLLDITSKQQLPPSLLPLQCHTGILPVMLRTLSHLDWGRCSGKSYLHDSIAEAEDLSQSDSYAPDWGESGDILSRCHRTSEITLTILGKKPRVVCPPSRCFFNPVYQIVTHCRIVITQAGSFRLLLMHFNSDDTLPRTRSWKQPPPGAAREQSRRVATAAANYRRRRDRYAIQVCCPSQTCRQLSRHTHSTSHWQVWTLDDQRQTRVPRANAGTQKVEQERINRSNYVF